VRIDDFLPRYDVREHHERIVPAPPDAVWAAIWSADLGSSWLVKLLFGLRQLPALLTGSDRIASVTERVTLRDLMRSSFRLLGEDPGREVVLGIEGAFWRLTGNVSSTDAARFREPLPPGLARGAWNFVVRERRPGESLVSTETRVLCADAASLRSFRLYWLVVGPCSGFIRRAMLRSIAAAARQPGR
jgi:hypothetical protein